MFFVFAGKSYYPAGGLKDLVGTAITEDEALEVVANFQCDWWHIAIIRIVDDVAMYEIVREKS